MFKSLALNLTETENGGLSYKNTSSERVNLFYKACRGISEKDLIDVLEKSWKENSLDTLKIMAYTRDIRGGKGERNIFRTMLKWLALNYPDVLKLNIDYLIGTYGRYDDIFIICETPLQEFCIDFIIHQLKKDLENLKLQKSISLLAKWFPSENKKLDKKYKIYKKVCKKLKVSPKELRIQFLVPLREHLDILENYMCKRRWDNINFNKVPSCAMHIHGRPEMAFPRNAPEKFNEYKKGLLSGTSKINAKILFPHDIVRRYLYSSNIEEDVILEAQWNEIVKNCAKLNDCLVLSDVSSSMNGRPMEVSIALGILISSVCSEKWKNLVLTFESKPRFHHVKGKSLFEKVACLHKAPWGSSTDLCKALMLILSVGINSKLSETDMPKKLIVISDMQFDRADNSYKTNYQNIVELYSKSGYSLPTIVFWNVNGSFSDVPVDSCDLPGVSLISGYSSSLLNCIIDGSIPTLFLTMKQAIDCERYNVLKIQK